MGSDAHSTAHERRRIAIEALSRELSSEPPSAAMRLSGMLKQRRPMVVSADIDGLVSATMLGSVAKEFEIVAFSRGSSDWLVHPSMKLGPPTNLFAVDLFSVHHDSVSNHVIKWGRKEIRMAPVRTAFAEWDALVNLMSEKRLLAAPSIWANTQGGYEGKDRPDSSSYKYPLGTAQFLLAMLEAAGQAPKFFDRTYLPWLVASCDGGVSTYSRYADNARVWWPVMAGAVGPGSLSEQIFELVDRARPHDFLDAVHRLDRERQASGDSPWLDDTWNLRSSTTPVLKQALSWLTGLTGWRDPVKDGIASLDSWVQLPTKSSALVYYTSKAPKDIARASDDPQKAGELIRSADLALNANFYHGGQSGSRFNWVGGW